MQFLYENQNIPEELESFIKDNENLQKYFEQSFNGIKPKNYCGFLTIENRNYFIIPKITNDNEENLNIFIYMLIYAYDIKLSNEDISSLENTKNKIFEIFIRFFADSLMNELKKGLYKTYVTFENNLKVLRGKYVISKNFTNFYHQNIYCEFDEFTSDNELNKFFIYAIKIFKRYSNYLNLHRCETIFDEVTYQNFDTRRLDIKFNRMNKRFESSYELALMILDKITPLISDSKQKSFSFLFDMAEVFEKFIGRIYKSIDPSTKLQFGRYFGNLLLTPDIITSNKIIDTKYKLARNRDDLSTQDKYQMFVYGTNFEIQETILLYPKHRFDVNENLRLGKSQKLINLKMRSIDLFSDKSFNEYVEEIKMRLGRLG
jgi:5-methylcytosine-specific restriction enzyme subunit McrC